MDTKNARLSPDSITAIIKSGRSFDCAAPCAASLRMTHQNDTEQYPMV